MNDWNEKIKNKCNNIKIKDYNDDENNKNK